MKYNSRLWIAATVCAILLLTAAPSAQAVSRDDGPHQMSSPDWLGWIGSFLDSFLPWSTSRDRAGEDRSSAAPRSLAGETGVSSPTGSTTQNWTTSQADNASDQGLVADPDG